MSWICGNKVSGNHKVQQKIVGNNYLQKKQMQNPVVFACRGGVLPPVGLTVVQ